MNMKRMQMSIIQKFGVGERRNHWAVWELHPSVFWGPICIPCKMCLISFLKVRSRSKEVISLPIQIFHLIHAITFYQWQKGKKVKKKKRDFLQLYLDFIVSSTFHQSSYCPGKNVLTALGCPPRNPTASPSLGFPVTLTRDRASSWRYCSHKS